MVVRLTMDAMRRLEYALRVADLMLDRDGITPLRGLAYLDSERDAIGRAAEEASKLLKGAQRRADLAAIQDRLCLTHCQCEE